MILSFSCEYRTLDQSLKNSAECQRILYYNLQRMGTLEEKFGSRFSEVNLAVLFQIVKFIVKKDLVEHTLYSVVYIG